MASTKFSTTMALFLAVNLLFFSLTAAKPCGPKKQKHHKYPKPTPRPSFPPTVPTPTPFFPPTVPTPTPFFPPTVPTPSVPTPSVGKCPIDTLKLGVCANVLNGLINAIIGTPPKAPCCTLIQGLADLEAAVCLCTAIKANILGINLNLPISLSLLVNYCGGKVPRGFQCP